MPRFWFEKGSNPIVHATIGVKLAKTASTAGPEQPLISTPADRLAARHDPLSLQPIDNAEAVLAELHARYWP